MQTSDFHREIACQAASACNSVRINLQWFRLIRWKIGLHNLQKQFSGFHTKKAVFNDLSYLNSFKHTGTNFYMCGPGKEILCINFLHLRNNSKISYSQLPGIHVITDVPLIILSGFQRRRLSIGEWSQPQTCIF